MGLGVATAMLTPYMSSCFVNPGWVCFGRYDQECKAIIEGRRFVLLHEKSRGYPMGTKHRHV